MLDKIKIAVENNPDKVAYEVDNNSITYQRLWDLSNKYANLLKKQGTSPIIIYGHKNISVIISIVSCIIANRPYIPIDLCTPKNRLKQIVELTNSSLILTEEKILIEDIECLTLDQLEDYNKGQIKHCNSDNVYIIFTSGSTGVPKGVPISKDNLNNFINWLNHLKPLCNYKNINVLNQASFSFDLSVADLFYSLTNGHSLIALNSDIQDDYGEIFKILTKIDVMVVTPTFMKACLLNSDFNCKNFPKLKCIYFCGEQLEKKLVKKLYNSFPSIKIINAYGPTEATSAVSAILINKDMVENEIFLPVGLIDNFATEIEIVDNEIVLKGKSVFNGYLDNSKGGFYRENGINCYKTGDLGFIKNGKLYCKGRKDRQVKFKGYRIELDEIEYNICLIKGVKECAVTVKYNNEMMVKTIIAYVTLENNINVDYLKCELNKLVPFYMIPKTFKIIDKLPVNQNGKIDRKALSSI